MHHQHSPLNIKYPTESKTYAETVVVLPYSQQTTATIPCPYRNLKLPYPYRTPQTAVPPPYPQITVPLPYPSNYRTLSTCSLLASDSACGLQPAADSTSPGAPRWRARCDTTRRPWNGGVVRATFTNSFKFTKFYSGVSVRRFITKQLKVPLWCIRPPFPIRRQCTYGTPMSRSSWRVTKSSRSAFVYSATMIRSTIGGETSRDLEILKVQTEFFLLDYRHQKFL